MTDFLRYAGFALVLLALAGPLAYCTAQDTIAGSKEKVACIEARGEWRSTWGGYCHFGDKP